MGLGLSSGSERMEVRLYSDETRYRSGLAEPALQRLLDFYQQPVQAIRQTAGTSVGA